MTTVMQNFGVYYFGHTHKPISVDMWPMLSSHIAHISQGANGLKPVSPTQITKSLQNSQLRVFGSPSRPLAVLRFIQWGNMIEIATFMKTYVQNTMSYTMGQKKISPAQALLTCAREELIQKNARSFFVIRKDNIGALRSIIPCIVKHPIDIDTFVARASIPFPPGRLNDMTPAAIESRICIQCT